MLFWARKNNHHDLVDTFYQIIEKAELSLIPKTHEARPNRRSELWLMLIVTAQDCNRSSSEILTLLELAKQNLPLAVFNHFLHIFFITSLRGPHLQTLELLLSHYDIDINLAGEDPSALHFAAYDGNLDAVNFLLTYSAQEVNVNQVFSFSSIDSKMNFKTGTALHQAIEKGHLPIIQRLLESPKIDLACLDTRGHSPLFSAVYLAKPEMVDALLKAGANPDHRCTSQNASPAFYAAQTGQLEILKNLVDHKANLKLTFETTNARLFIFGNNPLYGIEVQQRIEEFLQKAKVGDNGEVELSPLDIAVIMDHTKVIKFLSKQKTPSFFNELNTKEKTDPVVQIQPHSP